MLQRSQIGVKAICVHDACRHHSGAGGMELLDDQQSLRIASINHAVLSLGQHDDSGDLKAAGP